MIGAYRVVIKKGNIVFDFEVKRKITILLGDSGKGKSTIIKYINKYNKDRELISQGMINENDSDVRLSCNIPCYAYTNLSDKSMIKLYNHEDSIIFLDESCNLNSKEFATLVKESSCYFVLITRENLHMLSYSIDEIYSVKTRCKGTKLDRVYLSTFDKVYCSDVNETKPVKPDLIITEDSKSGYQFFDTVCQKSSRKIDCIPGGGRSTLVNMVIDRDYGKVLIIADGASFGSNMAEIMSAMELNSHCRYYLYLPESFEFLLLLSGTLDHIIQNCADILDKTYNFCDSLKHVSWETFYYELIRNKTVNSLYHYSKDRIARVYLSNKVIKHVLKIMTGISFE